METVSLRSLAIEYGVPSYLIKKAIDEGQLHAILPPGQSATKDTVCFSKAEIETIFWLHAGRLEQEKINARLNRRIARNDAVLAGIVSGVASSAIVAAGAVALDRASDRTSELSRPDQPRSPGFPWESKPELISPIGLRVPGIDGYFFVNSLIFRASEGSAKSFTFLTMADGIVFPVMDQHGRTDEKGISVTHGRDWRTLFFSQTSEILPLVRRGEFVSQGTPLFEVERASDGRLLVELLVMARMPDDTWRVVPAADVIEDEL